jgi:predicted ABC-type ATPase
MIEKPAVVVIGGPNGAGKSTLAPRLLRAAMQVTEFINADLIAQGLSPFNADGAALAASEILLRRMEQFAEKRISFGVETTLASRSLAPRLRKLISDGYEFHLVFLYLKSPDIAVERVADRVSHGGHNIPEATIRRRYEGGLRNLLSLFQPLASSWKVYDNSNPRRRELIASGGTLEDAKVNNEQLWSEIRARYES